MRTTLFFVLLLALFSSCKEQEKEKELSFRFDKADEIALIEKIGYSIENSYNNAHADSLKELISTVLLSNRMSEYRAIPLEDRRLILGIIKGQINENIDTELQVLKSNDLEFKFINAKESDNGYELVYEILQPETKLAINYCLFTLERDKYGIFKIADVYNIQRGYTFGEVFNNTVKPSEIKASRQRVVAERNNLTHIENAQYFASINKYQKAYDSFKKVDKEFLHKWGLMNHGLRYAELISEELAMQEYELLIKSTSHEESKQYYECQYYFLKNKSIEAFTDCNNTFIELLLANTAAL